MSDLLILAHGGSWDMRFQITSLAASAAAAGERVEVPLFFGALDAWVRGRWDELDPRPPVSAERLESLGLPPLSEMLTHGREEGLIRLYACSASAEPPDAPIDLVHQDPADRFIAATAAVYGFGDGMFLRTDGAPDGAPS